MGTFTRSLSALVLCGSLSPALSAEPAPRFSRHVVPVLSRLGCNQGTCHGAVKGQGGFRLSLFGANPQMDHDHIVRELGGRRIDRASPAASLVLKKATGLVPHQGGKRTSVGSPEHQVLLAWLKDGARAGNLADARLKSLEVSPRLQSLKAGGRVKLSARAVFADGSSEDVTGLCTFEAHDPDVAGVDASGQVTALRVGITTVVVRYGAEPATAQVVVPRPGTEAEVGFKPANFIDTHLAAQWKKLNLRPAGLCDDATFLRRASLDVTGALPTPTEVRAFLADRSPDRRQKKVEELLKRPGYAALWATKFADLMKLSGYNANYAFAEAAEARRAHDWLRARLAENTPYDGMVERILTATSREGRTQEAWIEEVKALAAENARYSPDLPTYARRKTLDLYWQREGATGVKGALQVAHAFLGLRLECAQCHRHPHDVWQQEDLLGFANFFMRVKGANYPNAKLLPPDAAALMKKAPMQAKELRAQAQKLNKQAQTKGTSKEEAARLRARGVELERQARALESGPKRFGTEVMHQTGRGNFASVSSPLGTQRSSAFRLLGSREEAKVPADKDPRELVMAWMRRPDNPFFARAIANRVWAHYFGRGIVDPPDHLSPLNPPSHPELLDALARHLIENKFDLRELHRAILNSRAYQLDCRPHPTSGADRRNFAYFYLRRLPAEALVDAVNHATGGVEEYPERLFVRPGAKAMEVPGVTRAEDKAASLAFAFQVFGRPLRNPQVQCDCERDTSPTIAQTLYLANHPGVRKKIAAPGGRVASVLKEHKAAEKRVEELFLWSLGRLPKPAEAKACLEHVKEAPSEAAGYQDVLWGLLNTREFILNH